MSVRLSGVDSEVIEAAEQVFTERPDLLARFLDALSLVLGARLSGPPAPAHPPRT